MLNTRLLSGVSVSIEHLIFSNLNSKVRKSSKTPTGPIHHTYMASGSFVEDEEFEILII